MKERDVLRILDVNLNRLREALRVCEEVTRFIMEDKGSTLALKRLRHEISTAVSRSKNVKFAALIRSREAENDVGKHLETPEELKRNGPFGILSANLQRAKESARVLEEFLKVFDRGLALRFKKIRFKIYSIEKGLT